MSDFPKADEIKGLISLLAPGLIIVSIRSRVTTGPTPDLKDRLIAWGFFSAGYYAAIAPVFSVPHGLILPGWIIDVLEYFLLPSLLGYLWALLSVDDREYRWAERIGLHLPHRIPAAWDFTFSRVSAGTFVLVTLNDGSQVAGLMGGSSFASSSKEERDLLLEEVWDQPDDGGPWVVRSPRRSILLRGGDVKSVEIYEPTS